MYQSCSSQRIRQENHDKSETRGTWGPRRDAHSRRMPREAQDPFGRNGGNSPPAVRHQGLEFDKGGSLATPPYPHEERPRCRRQILTHRNHSKWQRCFVTLQSGTCAQLAYTATDLAPNECAQRHPLCVANLGGDLVNTGTGCLQQVHRALNSKILNIR